MRILVTGGAGYIGSHIVSVLYQERHEVVVLDNFCNSHPEVMDRVGRIVGARVPLVRADVRDTAVVARVLREHAIDAVIHMAGLKAVGESVEKPIEYYACNIQGTISLLEAMREVGVHALVFSSSATVYGDPQYLPLDEDHPTRATNPYGRSKLHIEEILADVAQSSSKWRIVCLRYFNPVGAHESSLIGEDPAGLPNNLMPYVAQVAVGKLPFLRVFGNDYPTPDGTGVRDYIHVMDLAEGHVAALAFAASHPGWNAINLGTGRGTSVLEMVENFQRASGKPVPHEVVVRRPGDIASCYAKVDRAAEWLDWRARRNLEEMCRSTWAWQSQGASKDSS